MRTPGTGVCAAVLVCATWLGAAAEAQTVLTAPSDTYPTIQAAIDAAADGDTVQVARGTYSESLTLTPGVTVQGEETAATFLNAALTGTGGTVERFTVKAQEWSFDGASGLVIRNCVFTASAGTAVEVTDSTGTAVTNNTFYDNGTALVFTNSSGAASSGSVLGNAFVKNGTALRAPMAPVAVSYNLFDDNTTDGEASGTAVSGDPAFVDPTGGAFQLATGSACIDAVPAATLADPDGSDADCGAYGGPEQDRKPRPVTGVVVDEGSEANSARVTWAVDTDVRVTGYRVYYGTSAATDDGAESPLEVAGADSDSATVTGLTVSADPPSAPANPATSPGDRQVFVSWGAATGATGYTVRYGTAPGVYTAEMDAGGTTSATVSGLANGTSYSFAVLPYTDTDYYFAVAALGTPADATEEAPEGRTQVEPKRLTIQRTDGTLSIEVSETPERISGYPELPDGGFCFVRTVSWPVEPALGFGLLLLVAGAALATRRGRRLLLPAVVAAVLLAPGGARAQAPRWSVDARAGAFWPGDGAWDDHYDRSVLPAVKVGVGYRPTPLLEFGAEAGYRRAEGTVHTTDDGRALARPLGQDLVAVPLRGYALLRLQADEDQLLVPYLAAGLGRTLYRHQVDGGRSARGHRDGYHARAGVRLSLARFDPRRAERSRAQYGLRGSAVTLEGQYTRDDDFGGAANLGGWSVFGGVSLGF